MTMINKERLLQTIKESAAIGTLPNGGLGRLALSDSDKEMRDLFANWMKESGLTVRIDDFGNMYGRREGKEPNAPAVLIGSHLDTQPCGGKYDGILGVLASLEVVRAMNDQQIETEYAVEIVNFTNEEGARFTPPLQGSGGATEVYVKDEIYASTDKEGVSYLTALEKIGYKGSPENRLKNIKNYVELHIEQGPILEYEKKEIGVVEGIQGMDWLTARVTGKTSHAGPTPMEVRKDALVAAAKMVIHINEITQRIEGLTTTVGKLSVYPDVQNVIPGVVEFSIDIRHQDEEKKRAALKQLETELQKIAQKQSVELVIEMDWRADAVQFSKEVIDAVEEAAHELNLTTRRLHSGPGHDSKCLNEVTKTGMIFVPSVDGISHNEKEFTKDEDVVNGTRVLYEVVQKLANH